MPTILSLNIGAAQTLALAGKTKTTAIIKTPQSQGVQLDEEGLAGDDQVNRKHHGGPEKAMLLMPASNYALFGVNAHWGFLGENLTLEGIDESQIHLGDQLELNEVLLEVTQPRSPCRTLGDLSETLGFKGVDFVKTYAQSGRVGFYVRVLQKGKIQPGEKFVVHSPQAGPSIQKLFIAKYRHRTSEDMQILQEALDHPALSQAWFSEISALLK